MNYTEKAYINLISGCISNADEIYIDFDNVELSELIHLCTLHRNASVVYQGLKLAKSVPSDILDVFEKGFHIELLQYSKRTTVLNMIIDELNRNHVKHILFKGQAIAKLYPEEELRTMGDIDILIEKENMNKAHKIIEGLKAEYRYEGSDEHTYLYKWGNVDVELHSRIAFGETLHGRYDYENYYKDVFQHTEVSENYTYMFKPDYNLIYVLFHAAKHFTYYGCGVRMITDIAVIIKACGELLNWEWIWEQLEKIKLKKYAEKIFSLCNYWFSTSVPGIEYDFENIELVAKYVISGGVFGFKNVDTDTGRIRKKNGSSYFVSTIKWAFPSYKIMKEHSVWFKDKPAILLPIAYVERFIRNSKERHGLVNWLKAIYRGKSKSEKHDDILKILGLK